MKTKILTLFLLCSPILLGAQNYEQQGDELFAQAQYEKAAKKYTAAIEVSGTSSSLQTKKEKCAKCASLLVRAKSAEENNQYSEAAKAYEDLYTLHSLPEHQKKVVECKRKVQVSIAKIEAEKRKYSGSFSVSSSNKIKFSKGNLQFNASLGTHQCADGTTQQGTWRFAENQYDTIGLSQKNRSASYAGWIDTFEWGTSGWNSGATMYQPWSISATPSNFYPGGDESADLTGTYSYADWGIFNAISNGGNSPRMWRVLTADEWDFLLNKRDKHDQLCAAATVNGCAGKIILPDDFVLPREMSFVPFTTNPKDNQYSIEEWKKLEGQHAVFLPQGVGWSTNKGATTWQRTCGMYWSSTHQNKWASFGIVSLSHSLYKGRWRCDSGQVRLVQDIK